MNATKKQPPNRIVTPAYIPTDSDTVMSAHEAVNIVERTLDVDDVDDIEYEETSRNLSQSLSTINGHAFTHDAPSLKNALQNYKDQAPPKSGREERADNNSSFTPRIDDISSSSDLREFKMALGGNSDRSNNVQMFQTGGMMDSSDVIFSDEGSNDSFARDETTQND